MSDEIHIESFYKYLISEGYYFDKELIENFLLSLKVKPFVILTGNSGTGKTKLTQLFAKFLNSYDYHRIKVSTGVRSWGYNKKEDLEDDICGWTLINKYAKEIFPVDELEGQYEIEVGSHVSKADFKLTPQLYYDKKNYKLKEYFKELYYKEEEQKQKNKESGSKHKKQLVDLYIDCSSILSIFSNNHSDDEIVITMNNIDSFLSGTVQLSVDIFNHVPINSKTHCTIMANNIFANAYFDFKYKISNYLTDEIRTYLKELKKSKTNFQLKIKGYNPNINNFQQNWNIFKVFNDESNLKYSIIPVGANWTDNTNIVGYHNVINDKHQRTPSYDLIKRAELNKNDPYFLILDEMNLSHVERYFSDFLSSIESGEEIPLYGSEDTLRLSNNLFIIGTVNVDETTYMFSPKVLDRANVIEFDTVFAEDYMSFNNIFSDFEGNINYLQSPLYDLEIFNLNIKDLKEKLSHINYNDKNLWDILASELTLFQKTLKDSNFDFGFRVINEILRFMLAAWKYENSPDEWINWQRYFDVQIKQKILPKLHGSEKAIGKELTKLFNLCLDNREDNENPKNFKVDKTNSRYYSSALKLQNMAKVLSNRRYVSFIN